MAFISLLVTYNDSAFTRRVRATILDISTPIMEWILFPITVVENMEGYIRDWGLTYSRIKILETENAQLKSLQPDRDALRRENEELRKILHVKDDKYKSFTTARVLTYSGTPFAKSILVNVGTSDGVETQQPARVEEGVVGRTVDVGRHSARILLITDLNSKVPVLVRSAQEHAILAGDNSPIPHLKFFPKNSKIKVGDLVETSGIGGIFPEGIPVGVVESTGEDEILVRPLANLEGLNFVTIFVPYIDRQLLKTS